MAKPATKSTALWVIRKLREAGFQALLAGGCVRDMLLGVRSSDYDVATDATPRQVRKLFRRVLLVGAKFGVAMVIHRGRKVEVTTFRSDVSYSDGRRPDRVRFTTAREDALRRDFTINGMFYDPAAGKVVDYIGGQKDLKAKVIRTIGSPDERFAEDYLRMLRAVRFAVALSFRVDVATARAAKKHAARISCISGERILDELSKMLSRPSADEALRRLEELSLAREILPELFEKPSLWADAVKRAGNVARMQNFELTLGAVFLDLPPETIRRIVRRWGGSNELAEAVCWFAAHRDDWKRAADMPLCKFKRLLARRRFDELRALWRFEERRATGENSLSRRIARRAAGIRPEKVAPTPFVTGADLKKMGIREGPRLGSILRSLYDAQLNEEVATRPEALRRAREMIGGG